MDTFCKPVHIPHPYKHPTHCSWHGFLLLGFCWAHSALRRRYIIAGQQPAEAGRLLTRHRLHLHALACRSCARISLVQTKLRSQRMQPFGWDLSAHRIGSASPTPTASDRTSLPRLATERKSKHSHAAIPPLPLTFIDRRPSRRDLRGSPLAANVIVLCYLYLAIVI